MEGKAWTRRKDKKKKANKDNVRKEVIRGGERRRGRGCSKQRNAGDKKDDRGNMGFTSSCYEQNLNIDRFLHGGKGGGVFFPPMSWKMQWQVLSFTSQSSLPYKANGR